MLKIKNHYLPLIVLATSLQANAIAKKIAAPRSVAQAKPASTKSTKIKTKSSTTRANTNSILEYADSGVGSPYVWGGSRWSTKNRNILGADCSGFTQKAWGYPRYTSPGESLGESRLSTKEFLQAQEAGYPWTRLNIALSEAQPGDAMVYRGRNGNGHIFLVQNAGESGVTTVEARGKKYGIGYSKKNYKYLQNKGYKPIRLNKA